MQKRTHTVEATDVLRRFGYWKRKAQQAPVIVRNHGHDEVALISMEEYQRLRPGYRRVLRLQDFTDEDVAAIKKARMPKKYNYLNKELKNWRP